MQAICPTFGIAARAVTSSTGSTNAQAHAKTTIQDDSGPIFITRANRLQRTKTPLNPDYLRSEAARLPGLYVTGTSKSLGAYQVMAHRKPTGSNYSAVTYIQLDGIGQKKGFIVNTVTGGHTFFNIDGTPTNANPQERPLITALVNLAQAEFDTEYKGNYAIL